MKKIRLISCILTLTMACTFFSGAVSSQSQASIEAISSDEAMMDIVEKLYNQELEPRQDVPVKFVASSSSEQALQSEDQNAMEDQDIMEDQDVIKDVRYLATIDGVDWYQATYIEPRLSERTERECDGIEVFISAVFNQLTRSDDPGMTYTRIHSMSFGGTSSQYGYTLKNVSLGFTAFGLSCTSATSPLRTANYGSWSDPRATLAIGTTISRYNTRQEYFEATDVAGTSARATFNTSANSTQRELAIEFGW